MSPQQSSHRSHKKLETTCVDHVATLSVKRSQGTPFSRIKSHEMELFWGPVSREGSHNYMILKIFLILMDDIL